MGTITPTAPAPVVASTSRGMIYSACQRDYLAAQSHLFEPIMTNILLAICAVLIAMLLFWDLFAWVVSRKPIARLLYRIAFKTPYWNLEGYMERWWLFNPITTQTVTVHDETIVMKTAKYNWCPVSARIHHILRADNARDPHSHPGSFRTVVLDGWYDETRDDGEHLRRRGDTAVLLDNEFHHVTMVSPGGVWTLFIMWNWRATWGFRLPDGRVVPHQEYHNGGKP